MTIHQIVINGSKSVSSSYLKRSTILRLDWSKIGECDYLYLAQLFLRNGSVVKRGQKDRFCVTFTIRDWQGSVVWTYVAALPPLRNPKRGGDPCVEVAYDAFFPHIVAREPWRWRGPVNYTTTHHYSVLSTEKILLLKNSLLLLHNFNEWWISNE